MNQTYLLSVVDFKQLSHETKDEVSKITNKFKTRLIKSSPIYQQFEFESNNISEIKLDLTRLSAKYRFDFAIIDLAITQKEKLLFIFDMDSTLVQAEVINVLADLHGVGEKTKEITKIAMNGGMSFDESLKTRLSMLKGLSKSALMHVHDKLPLSPGVETFMKRAQALGHKTAIASGGFNFFADDLKKNLKMDYAFSNELEFENDKLTGNIVGSIINAEAKEKLVETLSYQESLTPHEVVSVGDGANDLLMLKKSHMGVAFHAKQTVRDQAQFHINYGPMDTLLYYLGMQE